MFSRLTVNILILSTVFVMIAGCAELERETVAQNLDEQLEGVQPAVFSMYVGDPNPNWNSMEDEIGKEITKRTGVRVDVQFSANDDNQDVAMFAASGEYPDLVSPKGGASMLVAADAMIDLTDLIEQYAPNIKKVIGPYMNRLRWSEEDPAIYFIPTYAGVPTEDQEAVTDARGTFMLQHAVVVELGYPKIRTLQDYENALAAYYEKHPTLDGEPVIPLSLNADTWNIMYTVTNPAFIATGAPDDGEYYIDPKTLKAKLHYRRSEEKEYFRWLNHMHDIGLLDEESFVHKHDQWKGKIASGRVLGLIGQEWMFDDSERTLVTQGRPERTYGNYPVTLSEEIQDRSFQSTGFTAGWGTGITIDCEDPVGAIRFLDFLASEEGQILNNWGIEGKHYMVVEGKRVIPQGITDRKVNDGVNFLRETGLGFYVWSANYDHGVKDSTGNYFTTTFPEQIQAEYTDIEKEVLNAYGLTTWRDHYPEAGEFPSKPWGAAWNIAFPADSEAKVVEERVRDLLWDLIPQLILDTPEAFELNWSRLMEQLDIANAGYMEDEFSKLVQERVKLWGK